MRRHGSTQTKAKLSPAQIAEQKMLYLSHVKGMVDVHLIPPELVINWDQSGIQLLPTSNWTMEQEGAERVEIIALNDKWQLQQHLQALS